MTTEKMNVHKALVELKILDSRITKEIINSTFCGAKRNVERVVDGVEIGKFELDAKAQYDKITDLINRRNAIKSAVSKSNATTTVTVCGKEYTVAEVIEMNKHGLDYQIKLLAKMSDQYNTAQGEASAENANLQSKTDMYIGSLYGSKENKNSSEAANVAEEYRKNNEYKLVDPLGIAKKISDLQDYVDNFKAEADSALSVSNATTEIEITY